MKSHIRANWSDALMVCAKCSKKLDGGFGDRRRQPLAKALRKHLGTKKGRKGSIGIVEVKCLGVCPRGAVTVVSGRQPGLWQLVPAGADLAAVATELGLVASKKSEGH